MDSNLVASGSQIDDGETILQHTSTTADQDHASISASFSFFQPAPPLAASRYNRQLLIPSISLSGQERISQSKVLVVGLGGLGSPASLYLAGAGVHTLGLLDHDLVEQSNLHRQIIHRESSLSVRSGDGNDSGTGQAMSKVQSALRALRELNSKIRYVTHEVQINGSNALDIIRDYDVVLDCTDNPATRYLVSDCCVILGKTLVSGAAQKLEGQVVILNWPIYDGQIDGERSRVVRDRGPCYRCVFPHPPSPDMVKSCSEIGILGPVVGTVGTLMASETIRLIVRDGLEERKPTMLLYNAWPSDPRGMFRVIGLRGKRKDCVACGQEAAVKEKCLNMITADSIKHGSMDYESWCGVAEDVKLLGADHRISPQDFLKKLAARHEEQAMIIDVREEFEVELGPKIAGSINIPISKVLRNETVLANGTTQNNELEAMLREAGQRPMYFICQKGNDSQLAAQKLLNRVNKQEEMNGLDNDKRWIGDVKGGFTALEKLAFLKS